MHRCVNSELAIVGDLSLRFLRTDKPQEFHVFAMRFIHVRPRIKQQGNVDRHTQGNCQVTSRLLRSRVFRRQENVLLFIDIQKLFEYFILEYFSALLT